MTTADPQNLSGAFVWFDPDHAETPPTEPTPRTTRSRVYTVGEPQGQCLAQMTDRDVRITAWQVAAAFPGMTAGSLNHAGTLVDASGYTALVGPGEAGQMQRDMQSMSGCALVARGFLRLLGLWHHRLAPPYETTQAFDDVYQVGLDCSAIRTRVPPTAIGDIVAMGRGKRAHMAILMAMEDGWAHTIDGGQQDNQGRQCVLWRKRRVRTLPDGRIIGFEDRDVIWSLDITAPNFRDRIMLDWRMPWRFLTEPIPPPTTQPPPIAL